MLRTTAIRWLVTLRRQRRASMSSASIAHCVTGWERAVEDAIYAAAPEIDRIEVAPGGRMTGVPHTPGTREYLTCERGTVELAVAGERYQLAEGDVVTFRGDQRHAYHNPGTQLAIAYSAIAFAPTAQNL